MHRLLAAHGGQWLEWWLVLSIGTAIVVLLAAIVAGRTRSAALQLAVWQVALLALAGWLVVEATGAGQAASSAARLAWGSFAATSETARASTPFEFDTHPAEFSRPAEFHGDLEPAIPAPQGEPAEPTSVAVHSRGTSFPAGPMAVWLLGTLCFAGRVAWSRAALARLVRGLPQLGDPDVVRRVGEVCRRLGFVRPVRLLEAEGLAVPVAFGVWRPTVTLPARFVRDFDPQQQQVILAHELAHLAARDPAWQLLADTLCAVLWWHPAAWWARSRFRWAGEAAADESSTLLPEGPSILAGCLVVLGRRLGRSRRLAWHSAAGSGFRSALGRRVERLLNDHQWAANRPGRRRLALLRAGLPMSLVLVAVLGTAWARPQALATEGETMTGVLRSSWQGSLGAMALAAMLTSAPQPAPAGEPKEKPPATAQETAQQSAAEKPKPEKPVPPPAQREGEPRAERGRRPGPEAQGPRGDRGDGEAIRRRNFAEKERWKTRRNSATKPAS
jgi:hypothetical protein